MRSAPPPRPAPELQPPSERAAAGLRQAHYRMDDESGSDAPSIVPRGSPKAFMPGMSQSQSYPSFIEASKAFAEQDHKPFRVDSRNSKCGASHRLDVDAKLEFYSAWRDRALGYLAGDHFDFRRFLLWAERQALTIDESAGMLEPLRWACPAARVRTLITVS